MTTMGIDLELSRMCRAKHHKSEHLEPSMKMMPIQQYGTDLLSETISC